MRPNHPRVGSSAVSVLATVVCLAVVLGVTFYLVNPRSEMTVEKASEQVQVQDETPLVLEKQETVAVTPAAEIKPVAETPRVSPEEQVAAHLSAGEFGQAIDVPGWWIAVG